MRELARRTNITATEASRQLKRLIEALLVQRLPEGPYTITPYGILVLQLTSSMDFVAKHKDYFATHSVSRLPGRFVNRIGELRSGTLDTDPMANLARGEQMIVRAERFLWALAASGPNELMTPVILERGRKGVRFRFLAPESLLLPTGAAARPEQNIELRGVSEVPAVLVLTESEGIVTFPLLSGRADYAGFHGKDEEFRTWIRDLFSYCWEKPRRVPPT